MPPYLAGRTEEQERFRKLLDQRIITENLVLTGLRGVGKTVLLETFKPIVRSAGWLWTGTDMSESAGVTEDRLATRLITDISVMTAPILSSTRAKNPVGFGGTGQLEKAPIDFASFVALYERSPGLVADKLKRVLLALWRMIEGKVNGVVFAYDEAQILSDHSQSSEYPLSMLLEVFQSIQRQEIPFMLVLTGLPTLFPKLVETRTYSERMFHVLFLSQLTDHESREAIVEPTLQHSLPLRFDDQTIELIVGLSDGYPYFVQFICKEVFDAWLNQIDKGVSPAVATEAIVAKLDNDFFAGRWDKATDRERELLITISSLESSDDEFTVKEIASRSKALLERPFLPSQINRMLARLSEKGLVFKNRHGRYSFAVPLLSHFIQRQIVHKSDLFTPRQ